ncbi:histidinol-phosphate transaminase [Flavobacteriaceae bacterium]|nr:histidinol-phosphate transaminase [Flavobacteriaceae bacterium]
MSKIDITQLVRPMVREITSYRSARDDFEEFEAQKVFLDANENPYKSIANRYPDPLQRQLKRTLAKIKGVEANQILFGNGSDEVLDLVFRSFCEPGQDEVIVLPPTYGMYAVLAQINNVKVNTVPLNESFQLDLEGIIKQVNVNTKVIFVCSPNNPTGNSIPLEQIQNLLNQFYGLVVVDEAYVDFSTKGSAIRLLDDYPHLMICQTFSKAYGLAGIRLGMGIADSKIIDYFNKIKPPYNVNVLTQKTAYNSLNDQNTTKGHVKELLAERQKLEKDLLNIDFVNKIYPSDANFLLIQVDNASKRYDQLLSLDIVVRNRSSLLGCENTLRITVGTPQENIRLINACKTIK